MGHGFRGDDRVRRKDRAPGRQVEYAMTNPRSFEHIDTWVFDLDNTLYPHHVNLWQQVDARIGEFVSSWLNVSREEARQIQKDYYRRFGTTMRGMMTLHDVHADDYLAYVHEIDHSPLEPNPAMGAAIARLRGRKLILTNGSVDHVDKVLERLGLANHFDAVFDIIAAELEPKPAAQTYRRFLDLHQVDPTRSAMFEDLARNLEVPHQLGMTTVLVVPDGSREVVREDWELEGRDASHVDYVTDDLTGFLRGLGARS
jgi:putative hydrolase of the HAD superfamily